MPAFLDQSQTACTRKAATASPDRFAGFRFRSVVDYVVLGVHTLTPSNAWSINRTTGSTFVKPINPGDSGATDRFEIRIDDPASWADVEEQLRAVEARYGLASQPVVLMIEVSLDGCEGSGDLDAMAGLAHHFFRFMISHCSDNARLTRHKGETEGAYVTAPAELLKKVRAGRTIFIGNVGDPITQRIYAKTTDRVDVRLPIGEWRARMEVTLSGSALPFTSLEDARAFRFESLTNRWFRFRRPSEDLDDMPIMVRLARNRMPILGTRTDHGRLRYGSTTRADRRLNGLAYEALRNLTARMSRVPTTRSPRIAETAGEQRV